MSEQRPARHDGEPDGAGHDRAADRLEAGEHDRGADGLEAGGLEADDVVEYDRWDWHTSGVFPRNVPPEHGFVHIAMYLTWVVLHGFLDLAWADRLGLLDEVGAIAERRATGSVLRDHIDGRLASDMLTIEGRRFTDAFYVPPYGFPETWQRAFGRRADSYAVPDGWETYGRIEPAIDRAYVDWVDAGRPESLEPPAPRGLLELLGLRRRPR